LGFQINVLVLEFLCCSAPHSSEIQEFNDGLEIAWQVVFTCKVAGKKERQMVGGKYSAVFGFESDADATKCAAIIRKATASKKKSKEP
jgi:hypothetical protein